MTSEPQSSFRRFARDVDQLLRGGFTQEDQLKIGKIEVPVRTLVIASLVLGALYGCAMGIYSWTMRGGEGVIQVFASSVKVPLLFLLTLLVTFPSLYVSSALARSRLLVGDSLRLLLAAVAVNLALLASFGTVTAFFTLCTDSYPFMVVLNVAFFGVAGLVGLGFLRQALTRLFGEEASAQGVLPRETEEADGIPLMVKRRVPRPVSQRVFSVWLVIYGIVGAQMGWILRPFVGAPSLPFTWFRQQRESNFFAATFEALGKLFQ